MYLEFIRSIISPTAFSSDDETSQSQLLDDSMSHNSEKDFVDIRNQNESFFIKVFLALKNCNKPQDVNKLLKVIAFYTI